MAEDFADKLLAELTGACWPLPREHDAHETVRRAIALRKGTAEKLRQMANWRQDRDYICDPLARRIANGYADFFFADEPTITVAETGGDDSAALREAAIRNPVVQTELDRCIEINRFGSGLHRAARHVVSEGERYWKLHVNPAIADVPLLTWSSRLTTVPLFYGDRLLAAAFVEERAREMGRNDEGAPSSDAKQVVWRHAEIHTTGRVVNALFCGTDEEIGERRELGARPETSDLNPEWRHGLPMLAGRIVNDLDDDDELGVSEYDQVEGMLLALNRALTISVENCDLTGQDRVFASSKLTQIDGSFDASMQVFQMDLMPEQTLGDGSAAPAFVHVEKQYHAEPLWLHITKLTKTIVSSVGLVPQWIGEDAEGHGETGVAIRLRFLPTTNAAKGKLREWQDTLPRVLHLMLRVISLSKAAGGFGRGTAPTEPPSVEITDPLPADSSEVTIDVTTAVAGEVMSRRTGVKTLHQEWDEDQVDVELREIAADLP